MKNRNKQIGIVALIAIMVFAMTSCTPKKSAEQVAVEAEQAAPQPGLTEAQKKEQEAKADELVKQLETTQTELEETASQNKGENKGGQQGGNTSSSSGSAGGSVTLNEGYAGDGEGISAHSIYFTSNTAYSLVIYYPPAFTGTYAISNNVITIMTGDAKDFSPFKIINPTTLEDKNGNLWSIGD